MPPETSNVPQATPAPTTERDPQTTGAEDRIAHAYCAICVPRPLAGQQLIALCGAEHVFQGHRATSGRCVVCEALLESPVLECGHPSPAASP